MGAEIDSLPIDHVYFSVEINNGTKKERDKQKYPLQLHQSLTSIKAIRNWMMQEDGKLVVPMFNTGSPGTTLVGPCVAEFLTKTSSDD